MAKRRSSGLSKSLIIKGLQCPKALWLSKNPPEFDFPPRPNLEAKFAAGTEVGILAQQLFPGGIEVPYEGLSFPAQLARTKELIEQGAEIIYEASFSFSAIFVKADILVRDGDGWQLYEVKMGTSVKPVNLDDVAIQHYVMNGCGLKITKSYLVHINTDYIRKGAIDVQQLFHAEDITTKVMSRLQSLPEVVQECRQTMAENREPTITIGPQCHKPYECDFVPYCWQHIPENSVFDLHGKGIDKFAMYRLGKVTFEELPLDNLNASQRQQVEATLKQENFIDKEKVREFLDTLWYPLCYLDFETTNEPIPPYDGIRPYQQVPFQFSLHIHHYQEAEPEHFEFLAEPGSDPRPLLIEKLLDLIPPDACVLTYNQSFEKSVLHHLAESFPASAKALLQRADNIRDLMHPFQQRHIYYWQFAGPYSIKAVLPVLAPEFSYSELEISDGKTAQRAYQQLAELPDEHGRAVLKQALLDYCRLDTLAMVIILKKLQELTNNKEEG